MDATLENKSGDELAISPRDASAEHVIVAYLVERIRRLPPEDMTDLSQLMLEVPKCESETGFHEIAETMREIIFPELIGETQRGRAGSVAPTGNLKKRMAWIGSQIKGQRKHADLTQEQLAEKSGLPQSHISRLESGQHSPSRRTLEKLAAALGIEVGALDPGQD